MPDGPQLPLAGNDFPAPPVATDRPGLRERIGLWLGPALMVLLLVLPAPEGMPPAAWRTAAAAALIATWWVTEPIPIAVTALLPLVLFPALGILSMSESAAPFANLTIFLYLGGFILALAMERSNLHRRVALAVVIAVGVKPDRLVFGIMLATAAVSMWVSNTATAVMMLPIALSVVQLARARGADGDPTPEDPNFGLNLMLGVAYAASIGGLGTLIGTPPNALLAGFMRESYGYEIGFAQWMLVGIPLVAIVLPVTWLLLTRVINPIVLREIPGGRATVDAEYHKLGAITTAERRVAAIFVTTALLWVFRPLLSPYLPGIDDAGIAIGAALALFLVPAGPGRGALMDWKTAERLPWGVLLLFGGGLALAEAVTGSGLAEWIGDAVGGLGWPIFWLMITVSLVIIFFTELASNTATAAAFLPLVGSIAVGLGENPLLLAVPAAIAASCGFMMPAGTPPNAIAYGSGLITVPQMARAGFLINVLCAGLIVLVMYTIGLWAFGI